MNKKTWLTIFAFGLIGLFCWHFLIKTYQHKISFEIKDTPGVVYSNLSEWKSIKDLKDSSQVEILKRIPFKQVVHKVTLKDSSFTYRWEFARTNDSITRVTAYISDNLHAFSQNLTAPFGGSNFIKRNTATVKDLAQEWISYRERYKLSEVNEAKRPATFCAYVSVVSEVSKKANSMRRSIADVMSYVNENNLDLTGEPFLQVTAWDQLEQTIAFDFCFPIKESDSLPASDRVEFKVAPAINGLKTSFNGNYNIADKAWYRILDYAEQNNIPIINLPTEVYMDDPHSGTDAITWEAQVFMPIKSQKDEHKN